MVLHFNVTKEARKAMVKAIETELGIKAKYLGVPSCAYQVGNYRVEKDGTLSFEKDDIDETSRVVDACVMATGNSPEEWEGNEAEEENEESDSLDLTVSLPLEKVDVKNLINLLEAKGNLIQKALGITELKTEVDEDNGTISFPWFSEVTPEEGQTYTKFIAALCEMTVTQKRITAKAKENDNEKYAFRCFLLRLGFIGDEFKADRKILLKNLEGSSAFKSGAKKGGEQ